MTEIITATAIMALALSFAMGVLPIVIELPEGQAFIAMTGVVPTMLALHRMGLVSIGIKRRSLS